MAKFLNTSGTSYVLEQLITKAQKQIILVSPYLQFNKKIKQLIEAKVNSGVPLTIIYGKTDLNKAELDWIFTLNNTQLLFSEDLHAKCYMNEANCIITSMNLYEFSQVNNDEMGVLLTKSSDTDAFIKAVADIKRIISVAEEVNKPEKKQKEQTNRKEKLTTSALAKKYQIKTLRLVKSLKSAGYIYDDNGLDKLTDRAVALGAEFKKGRSGYYFLWPLELDLNAILSDDLETIVPER
ncbi:MAG: DNA repair protein [bacterium]|nr:DNA repair protein [bacterium]